MGNLPFRNGIAKNLKLPNRTFYGWIVKNQVFKKRNRFLEINAVRLCNIQPHHQVLEVGFGPGVGLKEAAKCVKDGPGKIHGIELSPYMIADATKQLRLEISNSKLDLTLGNVTLMPYESDFFDSIYHCNAYYFWPQMDVAAKELFRVLKPDCNMITTTNMKSLNISAEKGYLKFGNIDPVRYMSALEYVGFDQVRVEYLNCDEGEYEAIYAHKPAEIITELKED